MSTERKNGGIVDGTEAKPEQPKKTDGNASFLRAARAGNLEKVLEYLKGSIDINTSNANGLNALHLAAKEGHVNVVTELLKRGANIEAATKKGNTALHITSLAGQEEIVKILVQNHAKVNVQATSGGFTPLYMAAQENHVEVVKYLLANSASQTLSTDDGFTPLAVALQQGHDKVVTVLLENDTRGKVKLPALHIAAKKDDVKAATLLLASDHSIDLTSKSGPLVNDTTKSGFTPLHIASHYGNVNVGALLIEKGADVNFKARNNITPLHVSSKWGRVAMVTLLLDANADIASRTRDGLTPLHCGARSGHDSVVDQLLERGAPVAEKTKNGLSPLHMAAQGDHVDCARLLLFHKAPLDDVTMDYLTPLHVAAHCGNVRTAKLLLDKKCEVDARALNGFTPLHIACKKNRIKVVELLLKYGASIQATTESGLTPLHVASFMGHMNIVIYLIQHGANADTPTVRGETALHLAARANQTDIIRILLRNGAQVDARAREQQTPLHIASRLGNVDNVVLLLQHGASPDATTKDNYSPLHIAAKEGHEEVTSVLLEHGSSQALTTKKGFTPLHIAAKYGHIKVARLLLQKDADPNVQGKNGLTPLHVATHYNNVNVALLLLESGASPHVTAKNGYTPLHIAAKKNQMDIATTLIEYGAKPNAESKNGFTPLHLAAQEGHTDMVSLLLEHKADVNNTAKNGLTPLHLAAQEDKVPVAEVLVKYDAQIDPHTKAGYTPLHTACHFGQINMIRFLLEQGASVNATTKLGYTPLHQAAQQGHVLVINLLLKYNADPDAMTTTGQTPLSIAQKLGYISVVEILKNITEAQPAVSDEKYKVVSPETMQEAAMTDSEDEGGEDTLLGDQSYQYLSTDDMKILQDDSISPIREERDFQYFERYSVATSERFSTMSSVDSTRGMSIDRSSSIGARGSSIPPPTIVENMAGAGQEAQGAHIIGYTQHNVNVVGTNSHEDSTDYPAVFETVDTLEVIKKEEMLQRSAAAPQMANRAMSEQSRDNTMYGSSYSGVSFASSFDPDNVAVDRHPQYSGFLVSFMVDARGGAMRGCRHSGVRIIIPPGKACMPTRVTCKLLRKDKLPHPPPIMESEALASRVLEMGPVGAKFLGPVIIEVPHFASLRDQEREIVVLRSNDGQTWREHTMEATDEAIQEALNGSFEDLESAEELYQKRITRILTTDFPHYFAIVTRVRKEAKQMGADGGMLSSSVVPHVQVVFPPGALTKKTQVGLQAQPVPPELVSKMLGNRVAVSPLVTVEPRRRRFHAPITVTIPVPRAAQKGMLNQYGGETPTLRLLCSITGGMDLAQWEDITGSSPLTFVNDCVSFTTNVSARFWLIDCQNYKEATRMATELYREVIAVPFMSKFVVFAKRHDPMEARLRVFCMTDDKMDKTLETQEHFTEVARSRDVEVLEGKPQYVEMGGNIVPVTKSGDQLYINFHAFRENRLPFVVRIRDPNQEAIGRLAFMREPKVARGEAPQPPICNLNITLPICTKVEPQIELDADELKQKYDAMRGAPEETIVRADLRLTDLADALQGDWVVLARQLGWTEQQIASIQAQHDHDAERAMTFLHEWVQSGQTGYELNKALRAINRMDVIAHCKHNEEEVTDELEKAVALSQLEPAGFDTLKDELGPSSRDASMQRGLSLDVSYDEKDLVKESESAQEESDSDSVVERKPEVSEDVLAARLSAQEEITPRSLNETQAAPSEEVIMQRHEGDVQTCSEVSERQEKTEDGRSLRIKVTVTKHTRNITETSVENGVKQMQEYEQLIGTEIEEDVMDLAPGLTAPRGDNIEMATKVQQSEDTDSEGVWTRRTVKTTVVNVVSPDEYGRTVDQAPAQDQLGDTPREVGTLGGAVQGDMAQFRPLGALQVIKGNTEQKTEVSEEQKKLDDGSTVRTKTSITQYYIPVTEIVTTPTGEEKTIREEPLGTEISEDILCLPEGIDEPVGDNLAISTDVEKSESTNPDRTFVRRITKTTKVTVVQLADQPDKQIMKGDAQTKTEVSESKDVLEDGTTVKTLTTVTEHFVPVTEIFLVDGAEQKEEHNELVGTEIIEDVLQLPSGVDDPNADNVESSTDVKKSESTNPDGTWLKKTTKKTVVTVVKLATPQGVPEPEPVEEAIEPEEAPVAKSAPPPQVKVIEGKVETRKYVDEDEKVCDDGTRIKSRKTTTRHIKPVTTVTMTDGDEEKKVEEKLIGTDIWEEVFEYSPDYDESLPQNIKHDNSVKHHEEEKDDGSWLKHTINTTKITVVWCPIKRVVAETKPAVTKPEEVPSVEAAEDIAVVPVIKAVIEGDIKLVTEVSESEETKDDGSKAKTVTKTIKHVKPITEMIDIQGIEEKREREVLVGTEIEDDVLELPAEFDEAAPPSFERKVDVKESEETTPEGTWVKKTVKTTRVIPLDAPSIDEETTPVVKSVLEGETVQRTTVSQSEDTLEDGTRVKTTVTQIKHVRPVTQVIEIGGVEQERTSEQLVGTEIDEDITELPVGYDESIPQNIEKATNVQESQDTNQDGSWVSKKVTRTSVKVLDAPLSPVLAPVLESIPVLPYVKEVKEGEVAPQTSVDEFEDTLPDGSIVKTKVTTTRLMCPVTEVVVDNGEETENSFEKLVGTEVDEDIIEIPVGYDENIPQNLERVRAVQESKEGHPDGSYTVKKTTRTTIRLLEEPRPVVKERKEGDIVKSVSVKESEETLENGTVVHSKVTTTALSKPVTEVIVFKGEETVDEKVEPIGTEIDEEITEMPRGYNPDIQQSLERAKSVEEQKQRHGDGTWTHTKTTKVTIKLLEPVILERIEGDIVPSTNVEQFEQTLPDGTLEKTKITTTKLEKPVKEVTFFNDVEATSERLELVGTEVDKEIEEFPVGYDERVPQNIERVQAMEEGREGHPDGTYTNIKTTRTTIRILDEPKPIVLERKEGDITQSVDVKESEETLENQTVVHTKITTTTHSRPVTEVVVFQGEESINEKIEPVGTEIEEEITEMPKGYNPDVQQSIEKARSVQEQKQGHADGTWTNTKTTKVAIKLLEPVVLQRTEGEIVSSTDVEEFEFNKPDGTLVKTKVTTTKFEKPVTEVIVFNAVEETKERMEPVGREIDEDITEIPVGYDETIPQNVERARAVQESREGHPDGTYTAKKTTKTTIRLLEEPKPVVKERKEGDTVKSVDVKETEERLENGTVICTKVTTTTHNKPVTEIIAFKGDESVEEKVELVGTEIDEEITEMPRGYNPDVQQSIERARSVQEQKQGHGDGTWTHTKTTKVTIRLLEPVVLERTEGEIVPSTNVEEFEQMLNDGILAKTSVTTTKFERPVKELLIFNGVEETSEKMELVGTEIEEDITEIPPNYNPNFPQNVEKARSVQEEKGTHGDGSYINKKTTKTVIRVLDPVDESEILPSDVAPDQSAPPPSSQPETCTIVGNEETRTEEKKSEETSDDGSIIKTKETTITHFQPITTITIVDKEETQSVTEKLLGTEIFVDITEMPPGYTGTEGQNVEMATATESGEETNSEGIWTKRVTTRQTIKVLSEAEVAAGVSTEPQHEQTECDESEEILPDGTVCRKRVLTTRTNTKVIRRVITEVNGQVVGDVETVEELAGDGSDDAAPKVPVEEEMLAPEDRVPAERVPPPQPAVEDAMTPDLQTPAEHTVPHTPVSEDQIKPEDNQASRKAPELSEIIPEDQTLLAHKPPVPAGEGEIQPDIVVSSEHAPPSVDASPASQPVGDVEEIEEVLPDGTVVKRRLVQTKMRKVVTRKIRRVGPDGEIIEDVVSEEVPESELLSSSSRGSSMRSSLSDIHDLTSPYTPVSPSLDMGSPYQSDSESGGVKIYTDTIEGEPQVETDVQETEETLPDGTVVKRKVIKTKQKQTIVKRVVMEGPENDMPSSEEQAQMVLAQGSLEPEMKYTDYMEGAPETTQDVQETEETLDDGSVVKKKVITTTEQQLKTERTVIEGTSEVPEFAEDELFPEAAREAEARPHPVFDEAAPVDEECISPDLQPARAMAAPQARQDSEENIPVQKVIGTSQQPVEGGEAQPVQIFEQEILPELRESARQGPPKDVIANGMDGQSAAPATQEGEESQLVSAEGELDEAAGGELQTTRLVLKKQVHKKTVIRDGKEETIVTEDTHVEQDNEGPDELREDMQRVVDDFMDGKDLDAE